MFSMFAGIVWIMDYSVYSVTNVYFAMDECAGGLLTLYCM